MPRIADHLRPKKNSTAEKLRGTPFEDPSLLDAEAKAIRLSVWRRLTEAQVLNELLTKPDYRFVLAEWKAGLVAFFDDGSTEQIFRVFSDGQGLRLELNRAFTRTLGDAESRFVEGVVRAGIEGFGALYLRSKCILREGGQEGSPLPGVPIPAGKV
jgi:hypothetical protein